MKYICKLFLILLILLSACTPTEIETKEKLLSSGIQYIGNQEKVIEELELIQLDYVNSTKLNVELEDYKLVFVEPNYIKNIPVEDVQDALQNDFYIFMLNIEDSRLIQETYLETILYDEKKRDKIWAEQLYLQNGTLKSMAFSIEPNWEDELLKWFQYLDMYKLESE